MSNYHGLYGDPDVPELWEELANEAVEEEERESLEDILYAEERDRKALEEEQEQMEREYAPYYREGGKK